jgi:RHS repeat-associated protein
LRTRLLITDALGSVLAQIKPDGSQAASYVYSPYGQTRISVAGGELSLGGSSLNATEANASLYTAHEYEGTNLGTVAPGANQNTQTASQGELYYYRARYYDPVLKRFISEDPIGLRGGHNLFGYVSNAPTLRTDLDGLRPVDPHGVEVFGVDSPGRESRQPPINTSPPPPIGAEPLTCLEKCLGRRGLMMIGSSGTRQALFHHLGKSFAVFVSLANKASLPATMIIAPNYIGIILDLCYQECGLNCESPPTGTFLGAP